MFPHPINTLGVELQLNKVVFLFDKVLTQNSFDFHHDYNIFCRQDFIRKCYVTGKQSPQAFFFNV